MDKTRTLQAGSSASDMTTNQNISNKIRFILIKSKDDQKINCIGISTNHAIKRQLTEKDATLSKLKAETDVDNLSQEITENSLKVQNLDKEVKSLKLEKSALESQRETASQLAMKKKDLNDKKQQMRKSLNKCDDDLETIFQG